jgi:sec-independent protein translocase protein TatA
MQPLAFLQNLSSWEIVLIFLVVLLFFGAKRLPELFRSFGKSVKEFKKATTEIEEDIRSAMDDEPKPSKPDQNRTSTQTSSDPKAVNSSVGSADSVESETAAVSSETEDSKKA